MAKGSILSYGTKKDFIHTTSKVSQLAKREHEIVEIRLETQQVSEGKHKVCKYINIAHFSTLRK